MMADGSGSESKTKVLHHDHIVVMRQAVTFTSSDKIFIGHP